MLLGLSISNIVLIEKLELAFQNGLTVLSGETGAGKSMLLDSLALVLGARSDSSLVRKGCNQASVAAQFRISSTHPLRRILAEHAINLANDEDILIRRVINKEAKSKAFLQDNPVSVNFLKLVGQQLVDIQGQFDQSRLLDSATHRTLFDAFAKLTDKSAHVAQRWQNAREAREQHTLARQQAEQAALDADFTQHAVEELDALNPQQDEEQKLEAERNLLNNAEQLQQSLTLAHTTLAGGAEENALSSGAESLLSTSLALLAKHEKLAPETLQPIVSALENALNGTQEARSLLQAAAEKIHSDAEKLQQLEERLHAIRSVARKHRISSEQLPDLLTQLQQRLEIIQDDSATLQRLDALALNAEQAYNTEAQELSQERLEAKQPFEQQINAILPSLKLEQARFEAHLQPAEPGAAGLETISFRIATLANYTPDKLHKIASAGELSRVLLAVSVTLADTGLAGSLVFDEVDSGIGGATASAVARQLRHLAHKRQILVITHSPQVAAYGQQQFRVEKQQTDNGTTTRVVALDSQARREEVARMLAGSTITQQAREAAQSLMNAADNESLNESLPEAEPQR